METFSALLALFAGKFTGHRWIPFTKASDSELWCFIWCAPWINGRVNNREAGDLRRHRHHYDVTVMLTDTICKFLFWIAYRTWKAFNANFPSQIDPRNTYDGDYPNGSLPFLSLCRIYINASVMLEQHSRAWVNRSHVSIIKNENVTEFCCGYVVFAWNEFWRSKIIKSNKKSKISGLIDTRHRHWQR